VPAYQLAVKPEYFGKEIVTWEIDLHKFGNAGQVGDNLLAPIRNWHGLQAFHISARDLEKSPGEEFGRVRVFHLRGLTFAIVVEAFELNADRTGFRSATLYMEAK